MPKAKNICLLIAVTLQFSAPCFSQGSQKDQSNIRIIKLINPVRILKTSNNSVKQVSSSGKIMPVINKNKTEEMAIENYNLKLIELVNYIKNLQTNNSDVIKQNETDITDNNTISDKNLSDDAITMLLAQFSDDELIKLANYIKYLETIKTSTETATAIEHIAPSKAISEVETLKEFLLREQQMKVCQNMYISQQKIFIMECSFIK